MRNCVLILVDDLPTCLSSLLDNFLLLFSYSLSIQLNELVFAFVRQKVILDCVDQAVFEISENLLHLVCRVGIFGHSLLIEVVGLSK